MHRQQILARCAPTAVLALALAAGALTLAPLAGAAPGGTTVTVRVEGLHRTLLAPTTVSVHGGWITKGGAPHGACPANSAAGALDAATHHRWGGTWEKSLRDYEITTILGERHSFSSKDYWGILVEDRYASAGACAIKLHSGEQLLFAAVPDSPTEYPLGIEAPSSATVGHAFTVTVVSFNAKGKAKPLAGATVSVAGRSGATASNGTISLTPDTAGTFTLHATDKGYIRAAVTLHVAG